MTDHFKRKLTLFFPGGVLNFRVEWEGNPAVVTVKHGPACGGLSAGGSGTATVTLQGTLTRLQLSKDLILFSS